MRQPSSSAPLHYEPRVGGLAIGNVVGTYPVTIQPPKYLALEGIGSFDDRVLRQ